MQNPVKEHINICERDRPQFNPREKKFKISPWDGGGVQSLIDFGGGGGRGGTELTGILTRAGRGGEGGLH